MYSLVLLGNNEAVKGFFAEDVTLLKNIQDGKDNVYLYIKIAFLKNRKYVTLALSLKTFSHG